MSQMADVAFYSPGDARTKDAACIKTAAIAKRQFGFSSAQFVGGRKEQEGRERAYEYARQTCPPTDSLACFTFFLFFIWACMPSPLPFLRVINWSGGSENGLELAEGEVREGNGFFYPSFSGGAQTCPR